MVNEDKTIEIIFSEFGPNRGEHGGIVFGGGRLDPSFHSFIKYFPKASIKVYTDLPENFLAYKENKNFFIQKIDLKDYSFLELDNPRIGYRCSDYFRIKGMLASESDICIYTDTDMFVCNNNVQQAVLLASLYGLCVPANPRLLFEKDIVLGADSPDKNSFLFKESILFSKMHSFNTAPIFFNTKHEQARKMLEKYCEIFEKSPMRSPSCLNIASIKTGYFPCLLPFQWCVSRDNIQDEIILHVGKEQVAKKYFSGV